jgi:hypothetical protein
MPTTERRFFVDDRGVVALAGLAMAVFMVGVLYYEIGIGEAVTFHEQLQDASDASGFASAVYHAKGMNMIVMINLIMSAVLSVIVVLRVLGAVCGVIGGIASAICWFFPIVCPVADGLDDAAEWCENTATRLDPDVHDALKALNTVATAVAVGMPWVAAIKSVTVGPMYYPQVTSRKGGATVAVSVSLIPALSCIPVSSKSSDEDGSGKDSDKDSDDDGSSIEGKRWGLPVEEGEFDELCSEAIKFVPELIEDVIVLAVTDGKSSTPPKWLGWVNDHLASALGSFPEYFCDSASTGGGEEPDIEKDAKDICGKQSDAFDKCVKQQTPLADGGLPPVDPDKDPCKGDTAGLVSSAKKKDSSNPKFDDDACEKDEKKKLTPSTADQIKDSALPKAIYRYAANGNDYMAVWSFGWGDFSGHAAEGISVATWKAGAPADDDTVKMVSKAEFFYAAEKSKPTWGENSEDSMWNPRWQARLRRVSWPMIPVGQIGAGVLGQVLDKAFAGGSTSGDSDAGPPGPTGSGVLKAGGEQFVQDFVSGVLQNAGGELDSQIAGQWEKASGYEH